MALQSIPSTNQNPEEHGRYPANQAYQNQQISLQVTSIPQSAHSHVNAEWGDDQPDQHYWSRVKRRLPDTITLQTIFDFGLVIIGVLQYLIYRNMRRDSIAKDRACVFVSQINNVSLTQPNDTRISGWRFNPVFFNAGNTIAERAIAFTNAYAGQEITDRFEFPDRGPDRNLVPFVIGPKSIAQGGFVEIPVPILIAAQKNMLHVYIYGWVEYKDTFNPRKFHRFEFCNEICANFDIRNTSCSFTYPYKTNHNGEDDDCLRQAGERGPIEPFEWPAIEIPRGQFEQFGLPEPTAEPDLFGDHDTPSV